MVRNGERKKKQIVRYEIVKFIYYQLRAHSYLVIRIQQKDFLKNLNYFCRGCVQDNGCNKQQQMFQKNLNGERK